jgi:type VI secretion system secreted protein VgrG
MRASDSDDAIDQFGARRQVAANAVSISSWDPAQLLAPSAEQQSSLDAGEVPALAVYDGSGERIASEDAEVHSQLLLQALERDNKRFTGEGAVRRLAAGHAFQLTQHERYPAGENAFKVLWVEHEARNNFEPQVADDASYRVEPGTYRNRFACVREAVPVVPAATALPHTFIKPGQSLTIEAIIPASELLAFDSGSVDVVAKIAPAAKILIGGVPDSIPFSGSGQLRIKADDTLRRNQSVQ